MAEVGGLIPDPATAEAVVKFTDYAIPALVMALFVGGMSALGNVARNKGWPIGVLLPVLLVCLLGVGPVGCVSWELQEQAEVAKVEISALDRVSAVLKDTTLTIKQANGFLRDHGSMLSVEDLDEFDGAYDEMEKASKSMADLVKAGHATDADADHWAIQANHYLTAVRMIAARYGEKL